MPTSSPVFKNYLARRWALKEQYQVEWGAATGRSVVPPSVASRRSVMFVGSPPPGFSGQEALLESTPSVLPHAVLFIGAPPPRRPSHSTAA